MTIAFYAGSFDPVTLGHVDIVIRARRMFSRVILGIGVHHGKSPMFTGEERSALLHDALTEAGASDTQTVLFDGLVTRAAQDHGASILLRGIRDSTDFAYEMQMAGMNAALAPDISTVFLPASSGHAHMASTFVRQIAAMGGDVTPFVPACAVKAIHDKFRPS